MSTVIVHGDLQAQAITENTTDVISRDEIGSILSDYTFAAPTAVVTTNYTPVITNNTLLVDGAITITLPLASNFVNKTFNIKRISVAGPVTIQTTSPNTLDGVSQIQLTKQYASLAVVSTGSNWWIF